MSRRRLTTLRALLALTLALAEASHGQQEEAATEGNVRKIDGTGLRIVTCPPDAVVQIDGKTQSVTTPVEVTALPPGREFTVSLTKDSFQPWEKTLTLCAGETRELRVELKGYMGALGVNTVPWTEVFLDGKRAGETPLFLENVEQGPHRLELINRELKIKRELQVDVPPKGLRGTVCVFTGTIRISAPPGSAILLDDQKVDTANLEEIPLLAGFHTLRCIHPSGKREKRVVLFVEPETTTSVTLAY